MEAIEALRDEGVDLFGSDSGDKKETAFEKATVDVSRGMHRPDKEQAELHGNIPMKVLSPVYEMHVIENASRTEHNMMKRDRTVSKAQEQRNEAYVKIMEESNKNLMRELAALDGRSRDDANTNIGSLAAAEQARNAGLFPDMGSPGLASRMKKWLTGKP